MKKLKTPSFAAQVNRDDIMDAISRIDIPLDDIIEFIIEKQKNVSWSFAVRLHDPKIIKPALRRRRSIAQPPESLQIYEIW